MIRATVHPLMLAGCARSATENIISECQLKAPPWLIAECWRYDPQQEKGRRK